MHSRSTPVSALSHNIVQRWRCIYLSFGTDSIDALCQRLQADDNSDASKISSDLVDSISHDPVADLRDMLFHGWNRNLDAQGLLTAVGGDGMLRDLTGLRARANVDAINELKALGALGQHTKFWKRNLYMQNTRFFDCFVANPLPRLNFIPKAEDEPHWNTLAGMAMSDHYTYLVDVISNSTFSFDIWKVVHQFVLSRRRPDDVQIICDQFLLAAGFKGRLLDSGENETDPAVDMDWELEQEEGGSDSDWVDDDVSEASSAKSNPEDPYVMIIPWQELELTTVACLESAGTDVFLPYPPQVPISDQMAPTHWVLWKPPSPNFFDSHALHIDDELYEYRILNGWEFPGHFFHDRVVFAMSPLEATKFLADMHHFWHHWARASIFPGLACL